MYDRRILGQLRDLVRNSPAILDVLLHRAWISTLGVIVVGLLLIRNDQSRDVLSGLGEGVLFFNQFDPATAWYIAGSYGAFWVSAVLLATVLALVAYVTGGDNAVAVWRSAQIVVLVTLYIIYLAVLWQMRAASVGMIALPVFLLAIVFGPWRMLRSRGGASPRQRLIRSASISTLLIILLGGLVAMAGIATTTEGSVALVASAAIPTLAMLVMAAVHARLPDEYACKVLLLFFVAAGLTGAVLYPWEAPKIWTIGSAAIVLIWFAWVALILAVIVVALRKLRPTVGIDPIVPLVLLALWLFTGEERLGRESLPADASNKTAAATAEKSRQAEHEKRKKIAAELRPRLAIHADGGGIRAALFTAEVLANADDMTCGDFGEHVIAASGVSGGSVGIATWAVIRQEYKDINGAKAWDACNQVRENPTAPKLKTTELAAFPLSMRVYGVLAQDHLSFALATTLTSDMLPGGDAKRGQALLDSWQVAAQDVLTQYDGADWGTRRAFGIPLKSVDAGLVRTPFLMFTATDADSGKRIVFLNGEPPASSDIKDVQIAGDHQLGVAALHSARFPLISPAGRVVVDGTERRAVDGGYFDNSGAATLRELMGEALKEVKVVRINGNSSDEDDHACGTFHKALISRGVNVRLPPRWTANPAADHSAWSGLKALMAARNVLAEETAESLKPLHLRLNYYPGFDPKCEALVLAKDFKKESPPPCVQQTNQACWGGLLPPRAPLGWYLSPSAATAVHQLARNEAVRLLQDMGMIAGVR